jgi:hypothetical protein
VCQLAFCPAGEAWVIVDNCGMALCREARDYGWCGKCYANRRGRANYAGHFLYRVPVRKDGRQCAKLKIPSKGSLRSSPSVPTSLESVFLSDYKEVQVFLCSVSAEGTLQRAPGSLLLFVEGGKWKAKLKDKEEQLYCFVSADGLDELLGSIEAGLEGGTLDWRVETEYDGKGKRK